MLDNLGAKVHTLFRNVEIFLYFFCLIFHVFAEIKKVGMAS